MNLKILATAVVLLVAGFATPSKAQNTYNNSPVQPNQVPNACIQNQSETLSVPKSDVSPNHWAFKAVMTMHYCGAFRQATPTTLWQQLIPTESQQAPQKKPQNSGS
ncbi:S-layer protein [Brasilonema sp. UFV-L1]|nr:S-layer protein [Brasilonema sp. UFV-L1]